MKEDKKGKLGSGSNVVKKFSNMAIKNVISKI